MAVTITSLVKLCYKIWNFIDKVNLGNKSLLLLSNEIESFSDILVSTRKIFNNELGNLKQASSPEIQEWLKILEGLLEGSQYTLTSLDGLLGQANVGMRQPRGIVVDIFKNHRKMDEIMLHKGQLAVHRQTLNLCITAYPPLTC